MNANKANTASDLHGLNMEELHGLIDNIRMIMMVTYGAELSIAPGAAAVLEAISDYAADCQGAILTEIKARAPTSLEEAKLRGWALVKFYASFGDDLGPLGAAALALGTEPPRVAS